MKEELFIILAIEKIARKTGWGPLDTWTNYNYSLLNEDIRKVTGKRLSESTLKRMFGKKKTPGDFYNPHTYTKNVLAEYLGYNNWDEYKRQNQSEAGPYDEETNQDLQNSSRSKRSGWLIAASVLFGLLVVIMSLRNVIFPEKQHNPLKQFTCENPVGKLPYTALFDYDLVPVTDSVIVNFGNSEEYFLSPRQETDHRIL